MYNINPLTANFSIPNNLIFIKFSLLGSSQREESEFFIKIRLLDMGSQLSKINIQYIKLIFICIMSIIQWLISPYLVI